MIKKITFLFGFLFTFIWFSGVFFKMLHLPGTALLLIFGSLGLIIILPFYIYLIKKSIVKIENVKQVWAGIFAIGLCALATLMKIFHLQGADIVLISFYLVFLILFLPLFFYKQYKKATN